MRMPPTSRGLIDRLALNCHNLYHRVWIKLLIGPIVLAIPPILITTYYGVSDFKSQVTNYTPNLAKALNDYVVIGVLIAALYPTLILALARFVLQRVDSNALTAFWLTRLNAALDRVVGCKAIRFEEHATSNKLHSREDAFCLVTQPEIQIGELVRGICEFFNAVRPANEDKLIRVILAVVENGKIIKIAFQFPEDEFVRTPLHVLNDPKSTIQTALRNGEIVVIPSIVAEMKKPRDRQRYASGGNSLDDVGSLICYPVICSNTREIPFVVSIHCDEDGYFNEEKRCVYQHTLDRFGLRMQLEYSLMRLKERVCEPTY